MGRYTVKECEDADLPAIREIFNHEVLHTTALYEYEPRTLDALKVWYAGRQQGKFPVVGGFDDQGRLAGFASYGPFRPQPGYKFTVEHSVYVDEGHRRRGLGRLLLSEIIARARKQEYHVMIGVIDRENAASIDLHASLGFEHAGTVNQSGFKFGRWLDAAFYQLILQAPSYPRPVRAGSTLPLREKMDDNSADRTQDVFFYGLYMDPSILEGKGVPPRYPRMATAHGYEVKVGAKTTLLRKAGSKASGMVYSLTHMELESLYRGSGLTGYYPEALQVELNSGEVVPVLCCNLLSPADWSDPNPDYASRLAQVKKELGLDP